LVSSVDLSPVDKGFSNPGFSNGSAVGSYLVKLADMLRTAGRFLSDRGGQKQSEIQRTARKRQVYAPVHHHQKLTNRLSFSPGDLLA
jgi:hypothetical protein